MECLAHAQIAYLDMDRVDTHEAKMTKANSFERISTKMPSVSVCVRRTSTRVCVSSKYCLLFVHLG